MYELGIRHAFNRPVVLVKDRSTDKVFDIQGLRYTEYDHSLRIDSVQKDIDKISKTINETSTATETDINSVIKLAGLKVAEVPEARTVSADTQLILTAVSSLERRLERAESRNRGQKLFRIENEMAIFEDTTEASVGDDVYNEKRGELGVIFDIRPQDEIIIIRDNNAKVTAFAAYSIKSRGLTAMPGSRENRVGRPPK